MPIVDQAGFDAIACNRCGQCCEGMKLDFSPEDKLAEVSADGRHYAGLTHEESVADAEMVRDMLVPTEPYSDGTPRRRCTHFVRDEDGKGVCTVYARRPHMCSRFPYGEPQAFAGCAWNVRIARRVLPMAATEPGGAR